MSLKYVHLPVHTFEKTFLSSFVIILIALLSVLSLTDLSLAQWTSDTDLNTPVVTANLNQEFHDMISDGTGGTIIAWRDGRSGTSNYNIYAQRLDANGNSMWGTNGIAICTATGSQSGVKLVSDDNNGAILVWSDNRSGNSDIYAQHINANGVVQWGTNGKVICSDASSQYDPQIVTDMNGGAIISWDDSRGNGNVYAQHINSSGTILWTANGVGICTASTNQTFETIASDNSSGAILAWRDYRNGTWDIYAQRISNLGTVMWTVNGIPVCIAANTQDRVVMSNNYTGVVMAWRDGRNGTGNYDIYAQRINKVDGAMQWGTNGLAVCTASGNQDRPSIETIRLDWALIAWEDLRNGTSNRDIYAQLVIAGVVNWTANGVAVCNASSNQYNPKIAVNGVSYGSVITWDDYRSGVGGNIYAQSLDQLSNRRWTSDGVLISDATGVQRNPLIIRDAANGSVISWIDERTGSTSEDIYAGHIDYNGILQDTEDPAAPGGLSATSSGSVDKRITLNWTASTSGDVAGYLVYRHTSSFSDTTNRRIAAPGKVTSYNDNTPSYGTFYYRVYAKDGAGRVSTSSNLASQISPDHLNPNPPTALSASHSQTVERRINLSWTVSSSGDVTHYLIYRHTATLSDTTNKKIATIAALSSYADTPATFGTFYYRVYAKDGSNNLSTNSNEVSRSNLYAQPGSQPSNFQFTARSTSGLSVSFDAAPGPPDGYIALRRSGSAPTGVPVDGTSYTAGNAIGDGQVVYSGNGTGFNDSGLNPATAYYYKIFSYNGETIHINYLTTLAPLAANTVTLASQPVNQPTQLTFSNITNNSFRITFNRSVDSAAGYLVLRNRESVPSTIPTDGTFYSEAQVIGDSYVSYVGPDTTFEESGLTQGTYFYAVYAYNGSGSSTNYLTANPLQNNQSTLVSEPTNQATNLVFSNIAETSLSVSFTPAAGNPSGYIVLRNSSASPAGIPVDGTSYSVGQNIGSDMVVNVGAAINPKENPHAEDPAAERRQKVDVKWYNNLTDNEKSKDTADAARTCTEGSFFNR